MMTEEKLRAEINELKAENATLKEAMRWRNIETEPPKEGQQILAVGHDNTGWVYKFRYDPRMWGGSFGATLPKVYKLWLPVPVPSEVTK